MRLTDTVYSYGDYVKAEDLEAAFCPQEYLAQFTRLHPDGMELNHDNIVSAAASGFNSLWLIDALELPFTGYLEYKDGEDWMRLNYQDGKLHGVSESVCDGTLSIHTMVRGEVHSQDDKPSSVSKHHDGTLTNVWHVRGRIGRGDGSDPCVVRSKDEFLYRTYKLADGALIADGPYQTIYRHTELCAAFYRAGVRTASVTHVPGHLSVEVYPSRTHWTDAHFLVKAENSGIPAGSLRYPSEVDACARALEWTTGKAKELVY